MNDHPPPAKDEKQVLLVFDVCKLFDWLMKLKRDSQKRKSVERKDDSN